MYNPDIVLVLPNSEAPQRSLSNAHLQRNTMFSPKVSGDFPFWTVTGMLESQLLFLQVNHRLQRLINQDLEGAEPSKAHLWLAAPWDGTRGRCTHGRTAAGVREQPLSTCTWTGRPGHCVSIYILAGCFLF